MFASFTNHWRAFCNIGQFKLVVLDRNVMEEEEEEVEEVEEEVEVMEERQKSRRRPGLV